MMAGEDTLTGMSRLSIEDEVQFWEGNKPAKVTTIEVEDSDSDDYEDDSNSTCLPSQREDLGRGMRERWLDKSREMIRRRSESECRLLVRTSHGPDSGCICMDMTEIQACRDLGLELPCDWTVEIPRGVSSSSAASSSPIASWTISGPGDDPDEVKARLKVWAQAVALASATHLATG